MNVLPVIARELRAEARHGFTYWLRVLGAAVMLAVGVWAWVGNNLTMGDGGQLFAVMHATLFFSIWILVPLMTADCISRERREGTLGLLFLTPLKARDIVLAKGLAHGLRAATLCVAVLPMLTLPLLLGGVGWLEVVMSVMVNFSALCWALAAGLLGSSWCKTWLRAVILTGMLTMIFASCFLVLICFATILGLFHFFAFQSWLGFREEHFVDWAIQFATNGRGAWAEMLAGAGGSGRAALLSAAGMISVISFVTLLFFVGVAASSTRRDWQESPPSALRLWWQREFCTPVVGRSLLRRWMRRKLERNPIGWLEQRTWSGRLVSWSWLAIMVCVLTWVLEIQVSYWGDALSMLAFMSWPLVGSMAFTAAGSFRRERESGVLELLLVSPVSEARIIGGRLRGLWGQFLPAVVLLFGIWVYFAVAAPTFMYERRNEGWQIVFHAVTILTLPVVGLYYSLRYRHIISSFLMTLTMGIVAPVVLPYLPVLLLSLLQYAGIDDGRGSSAGEWALRVHLHYGQYVTMLIRILLAVGLFKLLQRSLTRRTFAFQQGRG
jgi:ABC-type transport system involved in multi-copper enzyme maturation permease subunit